MLQQVGCPAVVGEGSRLAAGAVVVHQGASDQFLVLGEVVGEGLDGVLVAPVALGRDCEGAQEVADVAAPVPVETHCLLVRRSHPSFAPVAAGQQDAGGLPGSGRRE
ncbi:hypothetical protein [Streptomyces sp. NBC_00996]|uniref:hypothetical protein n=1 Tax=Streptomyces sp. NBC_00996 TaxID=2903710 RepID=UPI003870DDDC|nr:hypothetical protein OG390_43690 [Streptomyces sp. NBC_00996]